jgi:hypothetical protein
VRLRESPDCLAPILFDGGGNIGDKRRTADLASAVRLPLV